MVYALWYAVLAVGAVIICYFSLPGGRKAALRPVPVRVDAGRGTPRLR